MKRRPTKALKADDLIGTRPKEGRPTLGQHHHLLAQGIGGKKKRNKKALKLENVRKYLERLRQQNPDLDTKPTNKIESLLAKIWPDKTNLPKRDVINRALGRRED
jgi:hypothetical protein